MAAKRALPGGPASGRGLESACLGVALPPPAWRQDGRGCTRERWRESHLQRRAGVHADGLGAPSRKHWLTWLHFENCTFTFLCVKQHKCGSANGFERMLPGVTWQKGEQVSSGVWCSQRVAQNARRKARAGGRGGFRWPPRKWHKCSFGATCHRALGSPAPYLSSQHLLRVTVCPTFEDLGAQGARAL